jgi:hypothetical protein
VLEKFPVVGLQEAKKRVGTDEFCFEIRQRADACRVALLNDEGKKRSLLIWMAAGWISTPWMQSLMSSSLRV